MQARGGVGKMGARLRDEDSIEEVQQVRDHQTILFFTTDGSVRSIKAYDIPEASRTASGTSLTQVWPLLRPVRRLCLGERSLGAFFMSASACVACLPCSPVQADSLFARCG